MKSFYVFAFHWFVNIFNLSKDFSRGVIRGHHNHVGLHRSRQADETRLSIVAGLKNFVIFIFYFVGGGMGVGGWVGGDGGGGGGGGVMGGGVMGVGVGGGGGWGGGGVGGGGWGGGGGAGYGWMCLNHEMMG